MPVLTGTAVIGTPLTVTAGTWSEPAENLTVIYNWLSPDGKVSASGPTFTPDMTQLGATVTALATVSAPGLCHHPGTSHRTQTRDRPAASRPDTGQSPGHPRHRDGEEASSLSPPAPGPAMPWD